MDLIGYCRPDLLTLLVNDRKRRTLCIMTMGKLMKGRVGMDEVQGERTVQGDEER